MSYRLRKAKRKNEKEQSIYQKAWASRPHLHGTPRARDVRALWEEKMPHWGAVLTSGEVLDVVMTAGS